MPSSQQSHQYMLTLAEHIRAPHRGDRSHTVDYHPHRNESDWFITLLSCSNLNDMGISRQVSDTRSYFETIIQSPKQFLN